MTLVMFSPLQAAKELPVLFWVVAKPPGVPRRTKDAAAGKH